MTIYLKYTVIISIFAYCLIFVSMFDAPFAPHPRMTEQPCTYSFDSIDSKPPALTLLWHRNVEGRCQVADLMQLLAKIKEGR